MNKLLFFILLLFVYIGANAQCPSSITLSSQAEVDSFLTDYPDCTNILLGNLSISGVDITNLNGLSNLTFVGGGVLISENALLENIDGLSNITSVGFDLRIYENALLENVDGLSNITFVGGNLRISENALLENVDGLSNLPFTGQGLRISANSMLSNIDGLSNITSVGGTLWISYNTILPNIDGLSNVDSVGLGLRISNNFMLENIDGLSNINSVGEYLRISDNAILSNVDGLSNITSIEEYLWVSSNPLLPNIDGLGNINFVGLDLRIYDNAMLSNVDGLSNITSVGENAITFEGDLEIYNNSMLENLDGMVNISYVGQDLEISNNAVLALCCGAFPLLNSGEILGTVTIENNLPNCNSEEEILDYSLGNCEMLDDAFALSTKIYLQGAYDAETGNMKTLVNEYLPLTQSYNSSPYNYTGTESVIMMPTNVVDWVLVEARVGVPSLTEKTTTVVETKAGLLLSTGDVVGIDSTSDLRFDNLIEGQTYHICVRQKNHIDVLSANPIIAQSNMNYDFTTSVDQAFGTFQQTLLPNGKAALFVGDYNQDNIIQVSDYDAWKAAPAQINVYSPLDGTMDGIIQVTDYDAWFPNKAKIGAPEIGF